MSSKYKLGNAYLHGIGVTKDEVAAAKWFLAAAETGHSDAQATIGRLYTDGIGVDQNYIEAYKWYLLAGNQCNDDAEERIPLMDEILTSDQRAEGQRLAKEWQGSRIRGFRYY